MSDDPDFSRRDFLKGLAAVAGTTGAPELPNAGFHLHQEAVRLAMEYLTDGITGLPNDKIGTLAVLENTIDGYRSGKFKHHPLAGSVEVDPQDMAAALEDAQSSFEAAGSRHHSRNRSRKPGQRSKGTAAIEALTEG